MSSFIPMCPDEDFPDEEQKEEIAAVFLELVKCGIERCQDLFDYLSQALQIHEFYLKEIMWELLLGRQKVDLSADRTRLISLE